MAVQKLVKRIVYQAKCNICDWEETVDNHAPREKMCPNCRVWCPFVEISWTGPDKFNGK